MSDKMNYSFYRILEMRKILQIHHRIPTTFVVPIGSLEFSGISYIETGDSLSEGGLVSEGRGRLETVEFILKKDSIDETWKIKEKSGEFEDSNSKNIADVLLRRYKMDFK